jgi:hypothetical protein
MSTTENTGYAKTDFSSLNKEKQCKPFVLPSVIFPFNYVNKNENGSGEQPFMSLHILQKYFWVV